MKLRSVLINLVVLGVSIGVCLLLCEFASRMILNPADYLGVEMVPDKALGAVPSRTSSGGGLDAWGFRNKSVPETADIVVIGDSQTYGNAAKMDEAWPQVVGSMIGRNVYNMALGGYGPNQYYYLLKTKALKLKPRMIIVGLSMSDDFDNAYLMTYGTDYWAYLRSLPGVTVDINTWDADPAPSWHRKIRNWLSRHSVVYQLVFHTGIGNRFKGDIQIRNAAEFYPGLATSLIVPEDHIEEAFQPKGNLRRLDQDSESVREGMRITFELLKEMNEICEKNHIQFVVVVIPTKEMVFSKYLENNSNIPLSDIVEKLVVNERLALDRTFKFLTESNIPYVNPLPALQKSADQVLFARSAEDMHPNKNGYRVIAGAVSERLNQLQSEKRSTVSPK